MKSFVKNIIISAVFVFGIFCQSYSQSVKLLGADVANGAVNGLSLGGATMALQNSDDRAPLRVGLGLGILYGIGTGIYDNSIISKGGQFYKSATFNDGKNSTIIVLLDTFYGAVGGAAIGAAVSLVGNNPIIDGLQYGSGAGAWLGFGFGLIDSFVLAEGPDDLRQGSAITSNRSRAKGIVQITPSNSSDNLSIGLLNPTVISQKVFNKQTLEMKYSMGMDIVNMKVGF